jgi:hypothetical protein
MHTTVRSEKGAALVMALSAVVVIGVLIGGIVFVSTQDSRIGSNTLRAARAAAAAELGLNRLPRDWNLADNSRLNVGDTLKKTYTAPRGASVNVTVTKVAPTFYWAVAEGAAGGLGIQATARRRYGTLFRLDMPQMNFMGAVTTQGHITVSGNVTVNGNDQSPAGWSGCGATNNVAGAVISPTTTTTINGSVSVQGSPTVLTTPLAGDSNTYFNYGNSNYQSLAATASLTYPGGTLLTGVLPVVAGGVCLTGGNNWGDPNRATPAGACENYLPVIHALGDLKLTTGRGQGILLVDGDLTMAGNFSFVGAVIVRGGLKMSGSGNKIIGGAMAASMEVADDVALTGNTSILFSSCALVSAMAVSAYPKRTMQRGWMDVY